MCTVQCRPLPGSTPGHYPAVQISRSHVQTVFVEHNSLTLGSWVRSVLKIHVRVRSYIKAVHNTYTLSFLLEDFHHFLCVFRPTFSLSVCLLGPFPFLLLLLKLLIAYYDYIKSRKGLVIIY